VSGYPLHILGASEAESQPVAEPGWLEWLVAHLDPAWRPGEWDQQRWLFTSDLGSDRTAAGQGLGPSHRPYLQRLRACRAASHTLTAAGQTLTAAGRVDPSCLGAGDFTRIIDAISDLRRADGSLHSAQHLNLLLYLICEVVEHGRASGLMAALVNAGVSLQALMALLGHVSAAMSLALRPTVRCHRPDRIRTRP